MIHFRAKMVSDPRLQCRKCDTTEPVQLFNGSNTLNHLREPAELLMGRGVGRYLYSWGEHGGGPGWERRGSSCTLIWRGSRWGILSGADPQWRPCWGGVGFTGFTSFQIQTKCFYIKSSQLHMFENLLYVVLYWIDGTCTIAAVLILPLCWGNNWKI